MKKIIPNIWFEQDADGAAKFYTSIFKNSKIGAINHYGDSGAKVSGMPKGAVLTVQFEILGREFIAINGGPHFKPNPAISFFVNCASVAEIDSLWEQLSQKGTVRMPLDKYPFSARYGWIEDRFGVSWQLILSPSGQRKLAPLLLFAGDHWGQAEEALQFYTATFPNSSINRLIRYGKEIPGPEGKVVNSEFFLDGQEFMAMDSGIEMPINFTPAVSLMVKCGSQEEIDAFWKRLSSDKNAEQCGWLKDRFGVSWQIVPAELSAMLDDSQRAEKIMAALLKMKKLDLEILRRAGS